MKWGICGANGRMGQELRSLLPPPCLTLDQECFEQTDRPDIIFDFSAPQAQKRLVELCTQHQCALVSGTTALSSEQTEQLMALGKQVPVVRSANFSLGIALLHRAIRQLKDDLRSWDCEVLEIHHSAKKDAPSGTAKALAQTLERPVEPKALRLGNVAGDHSVIWANQGEMLTLSHRALNRAVFAYGAIEAAQRLLRCPKGYYTFDQLLEMRLS